MKVFGENCMILVDSVPLSKSLYENLLVHKQSIYYKSSNHRYTLLTRYSGNTLLLYVFFDGHLDDWLIIFSLGEPHYMERHSHLHISITKPIKWNNEEFLFSHSIFNRFSSSLFELTLNFMRNPKELWKQMTFIARWNES